MKRIIIKPGQVWVTRRGKSTSTPSRRVIGTVRPAVMSVSGMRVIYSAGGDARRCDRASFLRWIARHDAKPTRTRRQRTLVLR